MPQSASALTLAFEGFCMFKKETGQVSVFTPEGKQNHFALMTAATTTVDLSASTWIPKYMVTPPAAKPVYVWELDDKTVHLGSGAAPKWPDPGELARIIRFEIEHANAKHDVKLRRRTNGHVILHGGEIKPHEGAVFSFDWMRNGQVVKPDVRLTEVIQWIGEPTISNEDGKKIAFSAEASPSFSISNSRPGVDGLTHFHEYYEHLKLASGDSPLELRYTPARARSPREGNCVPPGVLPDAET